MKYAKKYPYNLGLIQKGNNEMVLSACRTIIFDLEFYVPPNSRKEVGFSYNPWDKKSKLIGGSFLSVNPTVNFKLSDQANSKKVKSFWLWDYPSEKELLLDIYEFLLKQSNIVQKAHKQRHSTILSGIGISTSDVPVLLELFKRYQILSNLEAFEFQNLFRPIDISVLAIPMFNTNQDYLYPKYKNSMFNKYLKNKKFECGSTVWSLYEADDKKAIMERTTDEVICTFKVYKSILAEIRKFKFLEAENKVQVKSQKLVEMYSK